jgi:predicted NBD/HSP70 family sugar kinase
MSAKKLLFKKKIIRQIYFDGSLSSADLSWSIKKSIPYTTKLLNELIDEGYVVETGYAPSTGGRRPVNYSLKSDAQYIISVALDQFIARIAIMDLQNKFIFQFEKFELPLAKNPQALAVLAEKINEAILESKLPKEKIAGVGIGMPGFIDTKKGINYSFMKTPGTGITTYISEKLGLPVFIDNDSSLIALAEQRFGAARGKKNVMVVNIGWGVGLGMVLNGELFRGNNGFAGEFSHIPLFSNGKICSCGKHGCLETETSLLVIIEKAIEGLKSGKISVLKAPMLQHYEEAHEAITNAVQDGDRFAIELFSQAGYNIGRGVAILIHILNPEMIILSGRGSSAGKVWEAPMQQAMNEHCIPRLASNTSLEISTLGYQAELIGSAALVMEHSVKESSRTKDQDITEKIFSFTTI